MPSTPRYQLFSPWPEQALAFTTAIERVARLIGRARSGMAVHFELTVPGRRMLKLVERSGKKGDAYAPGAPDARDATQRA